ncbi:Hypothetical Protein FCC1311_088852 [Hondaea fermentalgiana]|uniref:Uncharacterized protein n=1 Tax=Hondaea fermentalgiana TaxID=2315210 RepID=A0A2R5GP55_9STRA|nr:Hypothetical Protein FCC1311_088852 [Hondaea fermentalgiana]|eukprot:GBG32660.1 Hypothetical Protein FCC1311_088852 [Hondaea fermentalgiana]
MQHVVPSLLVALVLALLGSQARALALDSNSGADTLQASELSLGDILLDLSKKERCTFDCGQNGISRRRKKCLHDYTDCKCKKGFVQQDVKPYACVPKGSDKNDVETPDECSAGRVKSCGPVRICHLNAEPVVCDMCRCPNGLYWSDGANDCIKRSKCKRYPDQTY